MFGERIFISLAKKFMNAHKQKLFEANSWIRNNNRLKRLPILKCADVFGVI